MRQHILLEDLFQIRSGNEMIWALDADEEYQAASGDAIKQQKKLEKLKLNKKQRKTVDKVLLANYNSNAAGVRVAYRQGFKDALKLIAEMNAISGQAVILKQMDC